MSLEIKVNEVNEVVVISLIGNLESNTAPEAEAEINKWMEIQTKKMVVDLEEAKYVSSAGLRVFITTMKKMKAIGGAVKFCSPNEVVKKILDISGFSTILDVKASQEEAINDL
ncbi:STAS domain-containing protein [Bacteroidota bacterium]